MTTPRISVVIPMYNAEATILQTLNSVRQQTFTAWECIVIDDGSPDISANLVAKSRCIGEPLRLVRVPNGGVSNARNRGIAEARGDIIAFLDADDQWHPSYLARMVQILDASPRTGVAFSRVNICDPLCRPTGIVSSGKLSGFGIADLLASNPTLTCSNLVVRRKVFEDAGIFPSGLNHAEDQHWLMAVHLAGWELNGYEDALVYYRTSCGGLSSDLAAMLAGWEKLAAFAVQRLGPAGADEIRRARAGYLSYLARRALRTHPLTATALRFILKALAHDWRLATRAPWPTFPILAAACLQALRIPAGQH